MGDLGNIYSIHILHFTQLNSYKISSNISSLSSNISAFPSHLWSHYNVLMNFLRESLDFDARIVCDAVCRSYCLGFSVLFGTLGKTTQKQRSISENSKLTVRSTAQLTKENSQNNLEQSNSYPATFLKLMFYRSCVVPGLHLLLGNADTT